jgi:hypothetical protein
MTTRRSARADRVQPGACPACVGLPARRGHGEHRAPEPAAVALAGYRRDHERAQPAGSGQVITNIFDPRFTGEDWFPVLDLLHWAAQGDPGPPGA